MRRHTAVRLYFIIFVFFPNLSGVRPDRFLKPVRYILNTKKDVKKCLRLYVTIIVLFPDFTGVRPDRFLKPVRSVLNTKKDVKKNAQLHVSTLQSLSSSQILAALDLTGF